MKLLSLSRNTSYQDVKSFTRQLIRELVDNVDPADAGIIYLHDKDNQQLIPQSSYGYSKNVNKSNLTRWEGLPGQCLAECQPLLLTSAKAIQSICTDTLKKKNLNDYMMMRQGLLPTRSVIAIPLLLKGQLSGVIVLEQFNTRHRRFNRKDLAELETLGGWVSLMLEYLRLELDLKNTKRSYRELLGKFLESNEADRRRIAREIHDEINHILLSVKLNLEDMEIALPPEMVKVKEKLSTLCTHIGKAFDNLHRLSFDLRPPGLDELGLPQALDWYVNILSSESGLPIKLKVRGSKLRKQAPVVETALLRIAQESLSNTIKHAKATTANVRLSYSEQNLILEVEDDGIGFDVGSLVDMRANTRNLGLLGMKERAEMCGGELTIVSSSKGTKISTVIPIGSYNWGTY